MDANCQLFRTLRSGLRPHTRSGGSAADSIGRYAWTQTSITANSASRSSARRGEKRESLAQKEPLDPGDRVAHEFRVVPVGTTRREEREPIGASLGPQDLNGPRSPARIRRSCGCRGGLPWMTTAGGEPPIAPLRGVASAGSWRSWCCLPAKHPLTRATGHPTPDSPPSPHHCLSLSLPDLGPRGNLVPVDSLFFCCALPHRAGPVSSTLFCSEHRKKSQSPNGGRARAAPENDPDCHASADIWPRVAQPQRLHGVGALSLPAATPPAHWNP